MFDIETMQTCLLSYLLNINDIMQKKKNKKKTLDLFPIKYKTYYNFAFEQKGMVILDDSIRRWQVSFFFILSACLLGVFRPTREFFHSYEDVTITGEGLHILTYTRHPGS